MSAQTIGGGRGGVTIAQVQEAWERGCVVGTLIIPECGQRLPAPEVEGEAGMDENLVRWTDSFMRDRRVIMSVDGQDGEPISITTGLPQGSPISPVLFALYIADIHETVEGQPRHLFRGRRHLDRRGNRF